MTKPGDFSETLQFTAKTIEHNETQRGIGKKGLNLENIPTPRTEKDTDGCKKMREREGRRRLNTYSPQRKEKGLGGVVVTCPQNGHRSIDHGEKSIDCSQTD